jgi:photosynthetic reaction center cytochrome c subunit
MQSSFRRVTPISVCFVLLSLLWLPAIISQGPPPSMDGKTAGAYYKNIKVLTDIPASELIPSMQFIGSSLGVECDFCHVEHEFDKDDKKPKDIARKMMQMQFAINKNNFDGERDVTCSTCHRGTTHPQAVPAVAEVSARPASIQSPERDADHETETNPAKWSSGAPLLARHIEALGGKPALDKITARVEKGSALMPGGRSVPVDIYSKPPDARVSVTHMQGGESVTAFNGTTGWLAFPNRPLREMSAGDQQAARLDATAFFPTHLQQMFSDFKLQPGSEKVGEQQANVVIATAAGRPPVKLYFDKKSGLLLRMLQYTDSALGLNPVQVDFSDYRDSGGVKTPYRWTIARPGGAFTIQVTEVQNNVPIDERLFVKPDAPVSPRH